MFCHNWPLKVQKLALKYYLHWFWNIRKKFYLKDYSKFNLSGCASRDPSLQVENNTNRPLGLCKGWSLTAYRGDRAIGAAKYKFDHSIIMECRELLTDTQIHQPTLSTIITTDIFADSLHSPCWKDRLSKVFFRGLLSHSVKGVLCFSSEIESSILSISCLLHVNHQIHYGY